MRAWEYSNWTQISAFLDFFERASDLNNQVCTMVRVVTWETDWYSHGHRVVLGTIILIKLNSI